jgi:hypothetical protein
MSIESYTVYFDGPWESEQVDYMIGGTYYQCGGGGPEWGYVVKGDFLWEVYRTWGEPWTIKRMKGCKAVIEDGEIRIEEVPIKWERWDKTTLWNVPETVSVVLPPLPPLPDLLLPNTLNIVKNEYGRVQFGEYPTVQTPPPSPPKVSINLPDTPDLRKIKYSSVPLYKKFKTGK